MVVSLEEKRERDRLYTRIRRHTATEEDKARYLELTGKPDLSHVSVESKGQKKRRLQYFKNYNRKRSCRSTGDNENGDGNEASGEEEEASDNGSDDDTYDSSKYAKEEAEGSEDQEDDNEKESPPTQKQQLERKLSGAQARKEIRRLFDRIKRNHATEQDKRLYLKLTGKKDLSGIPVETEEDRQRRLQYHRDYRKRQKQAEDSGDDDDDDEEEEDADDNASRSSDDASEGGNNNKADYYVPQAAPSRQWKTHQQQHGANVDDHEDSLLQKYRTLRMDLLTERDNRDEIRYEYRLRPSHSIDFLIPADPPSRDLEEDIRHLQHALQDIQRTNRNLLKRLRAEEY